MNQVQLRLRGRIPIDHFVLEVDKPFHNLHEVRSFIQEVTSIQNFNPPKGEAMRTLQDLKLERWR